MPAKIFVNYRRDDDPSGAARVRDGLAQRFGRANVFMDVDNLLAGQKFQIELARALESCDIFIAVMGPRWLQLLKEREADGEDDFVRKEIAEALRRDITIIPVRVGREGQLAPLPRASDLPADIQELVSFQKHDVSHERYGKDMADLVAAIGQVRRRGASGVSGRALRLAGIGAAVAGLAGLGFIGLQWSGGQFQWPLQGPASDKTVTAPKKVAATPPAPARVPAPSERVASGSTSTDRLAVSTRRITPLPTPVRTERLDWRLASVFPANNSQAEVADDVIGTLNKLSSGQIRIKHFKLGELIPFGEIVRAVSKGTAEAGWTHMGYHASMDPAFKFMSGVAPLGLSTAQLIRWSLSSAGRDARDAAFRSAGVKGIPCSLSGTPGLWLRRPIANAGDLKGLKIRTVGFHDEIVSALGGSHLKIAYPEVYATLQRGIIDGVIGASPDSDLKMRFYEVAPYYYFPAWDGSGVRLIDLIINRKIWDTLSPNAQTLISTACGSNLASALMALQGDETKEREALKNAGAKIAPMPASITEAAQRTTRSFIEKEARNSVSVKRLWDSIRSSR
jgi:TRAP-type mannitol/chloroaromatic compound transport system substrate-binding protein